MKSESDVHANKIQPAGSLKASQMIKGAFDSYSRCGSLLASAQDMDKVKSWICLAL